MDDVVYQENGLFPIILDQICSWKISKYGQFYGFTGWRNTTICDFTGWWNMWMIWYIKKKGCVQLFEALYVGGNSSKWAILWFHWVEEHPNL